MFSVLCWELWGYRWHEGPSESFTLPIGMATSTLVPAKYSACTTCSIRRPLLEGKERATWLRGQRRGRVKNKRGKTGLWKHPWFSFHIWVDSMKRHGTRAGAGPGSPAGSEEGLLGGDFAIGFHSTLEALDTQFTADQKETSTPELTQSIVGAHTSAVGQDFLVVQWLGTRLPEQGDGFHRWPREDPTRRGATKPSVRATGNHLRQQRSKAAKKKSVH